jgi:hypothetical protein
MTALAKIKQLVLLFQRSGSAHQHTDWDPVMNILPREKQIEVLAALDCS